MSLTKGFWCGDRTAIVYNLRFSTRSQHGQ